MKTTSEVNLVLNKSMKYAVEKHHEYVTPEHFLYALTFLPFFKTVFQNCGGNIQLLRENLESYFVENVTSVLDKGPQVTLGFQQMMTIAFQLAESSDKDAVEIAHIMHSILTLDESYAAFYISAQKIDHATLMYELCRTHLGDHSMKALSGEKTEEEEDDGTTANPAWMDYVECLNDTVAERNPLIGRAEELERTIQILCRKDKNNPLHIGEPGVGKTAITYGLAKLLNDTNNQSQGKQTSTISIPDRLQGAKIYSVDLGGLLAGTELRGEFERRFKEVMDGISHEEHSLVYFDEIHNIVGAGAVNGGSFDVSNMLKPYLAEGKVRFIGATTHEEYKKHFSKNKGLTRRFQNIDVKEPSEEETNLILSGLKKHYEKFHGVKYAAGVLEHAVSVSAKYMNERYLPDKAIDLIDEAGAYRQIHPLPQKTQSVGKNLIDEIIAKICNIPKQVVEKDEVDKLALLEENIAKKVFGQTEAIQKLANAVKFSRAGLLEEGKPLANLLFVGPTGVGKTEIAKTLAYELGIALIRYDMSEYAEKHAVAKLIGSPAGYVGYEEGGLLTEEIRKHPHAVLLLDEIEKAHVDIYNILLQVMDYATLTDNQGRKADFRNIILIMTSNAGASKLGKETIGFANTDMTANVIMDEVKRIFQPEFRNRLSAIVTFNQINKEMAKLIAIKKLNQLRDKLAIKKVQFTVADNAIDYVCSKGVSKEYGAREIDRLINNEIKTLLVDQLLFGKLINGGKLHLIYEKEVGFICQ
jgi:ATP-dependent Clp protease ATP-binding subunit ClpA